MSATDFSGIYLSLKVKSSPGHLLILALLVILLVSAPNSARAQIPMDQKKLETRKEKPQDRRKRFTRKKKVDNRDADVNVRYSKKRRRQKDKKVRIRSIRRDNDVKDKDIAVRYSPQKDKPKDKRHLSSPDVDEKQHTFDFKKREQLRPHRPEYNYEGFSEVKDNKNPSKEAASFRGDYQITTGRPNKGPVYEGDIKVKFDSRPRAPGYSGDLKLPSPKKQERGYEKLSRERHQYEGNIKVQFDRWPQAPRYTGELKMPSPQKQVRRFEQLSRERHQYEGNIKVKDERKLKAPGFAGNLKVPTLKAEERNFKKLSKERHQYEGEYRIKRSDKRDLHPSSEYRGGKMKNSKKQKERLRKRKIWLFRWFKKNSDQPDHLKEKPEKPKYDSRESEIWYD